MTNEDTLNMAKGIINMESKKEKINHPLIQKMLNLPKEDLNFMDDLCVRREREIQEGECTSYPFYVVYTSWREGCGNCLGCEDHKLYLEESGIDESDIDLTSKKMLDECFCPIKKVEKECMGLTRESIEELIERRSHDYRLNAVSYSFSAVHNKETERFFNIIAKLGKKEN